MISEDVVRALLTEYLAEGNVAFYIVSVSVHPGNRIVVELGGREPIGIDDCVKATKYLESKLDRDVEDYELEVGSAGLTSPFKVLRQYEDAVNQEVEVLIKGGVKEKGILLSASEAGIELAVMRRVKLEGAKRKTDVEERIAVAMETILSTKRIITI